MSTPEWLTQDEADELVRNTIKRGTWNQIRHRRLVTYRKVGCSILYNGKSLEAYLDARTIEATSPLLRGGRPARQLRGGLISSVDLECHRP